MRVLSVFFLVWHLTSFGQSDTLTVVSYNLLNFPEGRNDCGGSNVVVPERYDTLRKILRYAKPDIFVACEIQTEAGADSILSRSLNVFGTTSYAAAAFHPNSNNSDLHNMLYYNTGKLTLQWQDYIQTSVRDIDHYVLYANDPNLGVYYDTTFIEVYMCHLKAGTGSTNETERAQQVQLLMDYIATRPSDRHHLVCGDLNTYKSSEACYQLLTTGAYGLDDPINSPGNWTSNSNFAPIHTQATRSSGLFDCGSTGGLDDRFDHILVSSNVMSGSDSLRYLANSYKSLGNDGNHYNTGLTSSPANTLYPDSVVRAMYYMSDHLPVRLQLVANYPTSNGLALYPVVSAVTCYGGTDGQATIVPNDGQAPYTYQWDGGTGNQTTQTAVNLPSGSYCVVVTDALGETDDYCLYVSQPAALSYSTFLTPSDNTCNGVAHLVLSGGTPPYVISWDDPGLQSGPSAYNLCAGSYTATVTDNSGCTTLLPIAIGYVGLEEMDTELWKVFPNPANDWVSVSGPGISDGCQVTVTDQLGKHVPFTQEVSPENTVRIHVSQLQHGSYLIHLHTGSFYVRKCFIK